MYALLLVMMFEGKVQVHAFNGLFMDHASCNEVGSTMEERLEGSKPGASATAKTYCFQIPESA
jgi:hypothetical protein